ncbi:uncharacterized protein LOC143933364 [Lithobates pipiens]
MDGLLSFLCLLCVLITPGHSLSCIKCIGQSSCKGDSETCTPNYSCGLAYRETTEGGFTTTDYILSCVSKSKCNKMGSISYTGGKMKMGISCCDTDNCIPSLPQFPATSSQANGLVCPSCRSQYLCDQQTNIQCTGSEKTCLFQPSSSGTSCVVCSSTYSQTCSASLSVIPANSRCATAYQITTKDGVKSYQVLRSWAPINKCNIAGSMTVAGTKYSLGISCCDGDGCTPSIPDTTSTSGVSNGVQCKTCESPSSSSCATYTTMSCTGQETQCVDYTRTTTYGTTFSSPSFIRGCATKSLCDAQNLYSTMNYMTVANIFTCDGIIPSNGGNSITAPSNGGVIFLLFSTLAAILILHQFNKDP